MDLIDPGSNEQPASPSPFLYARASKVLRKVLRNENKVQSSPIRYQDDQGPGQIRAVPE